MKVRSPRNVGKSTCLTGRPDQTRIDIMRYKDSNLQITNISEAKASLSHLIKLVQETNEPIIIGKAGKPVAVLSPFLENSSARTLGGSWEGNVEISEDFFDSDPSIENDFYHSSVFPKDK